MASDTLMFRWWLVGRPAPIWRERVQFLEEFIKGNNLKPIDYPSLWATKGLPRRFKPRPPWPGIVPFAHIHVGDALYALPSQQWDKFSEAVVADYNARLNTVKTVDFDSLMELSQGIAAAGL